MFDIRDIIGRDIPTMKIVDVGAMSLGDDAPEVYSWLLDSGLATVVGFEPVEAECEKLRSKMGQRHRYLPYAIGDGSLRTLHICNASMNSSLYEPNLPLLEKFQHLASMMQVVRTQQVLTHRLDDLKEVADADYLKIDVQGAELDVINGARNLLSDEIVLVQVEVEFVPMYKDQPLFAEIDQALRQCGFLFHRLLGFGGRTFKPLMAGHDPNWIGSQQLWSDAVYVKDFTRLELLRSQKLLKLAAILHAVYDSVDLCHLVLQTHDQKEGSEFAQVYLQRLIQTSRRS